MAFRNKYFCNKTFNGDRPNIWVKSGIIPLPKKGDLGDTRNYRGISLTVTAAKIYKFLREVFKETHSHLSYLS